MKALLYESFGDVSVIHENDVPAPELKSGQVRIAVKASGLNRADIVQRKGAYPPPPGESVIPGLEISGEVIELAEGAALFKKGDRVMALLGGGGYAEQVTVDERLVLRLPQRFSFAEGAAILEAFLTAHHNLFTLGEVVPGSRVLIHAGASGVGTAGLQLLKGIASQVFVTVGNEEKASACKKLGAFPILYREKRFSEVVLAETANLGVDIILDPVGGSYFEDNLAALSIGGRLVFIGTMGGREARLDITQVMKKRARLIGSTLRALSVEQKSDIVTRFQDSFFSALSSGALHPVMDRVYHATEIREAQMRMESNHNIGKIVLSWE